MCVGPTNDTAPAVSSSKTETVAVRSDPITAPAGEETADVNVTESVRWAAAWLSSTSTCLQSTDFCRSPSWNSNTIRLVFRRPTESVKESVIVADPTLPRSEPRSNLGLGCHLRGPRRRWLKE